MTALLITTTAIAYTAITLWTARHLYGHWRAHNIDNQIDHPWLAKPDLHEAVDHFNRVDQPFYMLGALTAALTWPIYLPTRALYTGITRWLNSTPTRSHAEHAAERDRMARRIADLEHQLNIH